MDFTRRQRGYERDFYQELQVMNEKLANDFDDVKIEFEILQRIEEVAEFEDAAAKCFALYDKIERALYMAEVSNRREGLYKLKKTDYSEMEKLKAAFLPYNSMWMLAKDFKYNIISWRTGELIDFDREKITKEVTEACQTLLRLEKVDFKERRATAQVAQDVRKMYEEFKPYLPLIMALRNPSLKVRHWENIRKLTGIEID